MPSSNAYIGILATRKEAFFAELQGMEFFSEYLRAVAEMGSDFAREVKKRGNWRTAGWGEDEIDDLTKPVHNCNVAHQHSKASREVAFKTIKSKWGTEKARYIR